MQRVVLKIVITPKFQAPVLHAGVGLGPFGIARVGFFGYDRCVIED